MKITDKKKLIETYFKSKKVQDINFNRNYDYWKSNVFFTSKEWLEHLSTILESENKTFPHLGGEMIEGNVSLYHDKVESIVEVCKIFSDDKNKKVLEVGLNLGHSAYLIMKNLKNIESFDSIDIGLHKYAIQTANNLSSLFDNFNFHLGDSNVVLRDIKEKGQSLYDFIHLDGSHLNPTVANDVKYCIELLSPDGILILDDIDMTDVTKEYISQIESKKEYEILGKAHGGSGALYIHKKRKMNENIF